MLDSKKIIEISIENENETKEIFEQLGFRVFKLDCIKRYTNSSKCPDYLLDKSELKILCEVKTIFSSGQVEVTRDLPDGTEEKSNEQVSFSAGEMKYNASFPIDASHIVKKTCDAALNDSIAKYKSITQNHDEFKRLPYLVALYCDFYADSFDFLDIEIKRFPQISLVIKKYDNCSMKNILDMYSTHQLEVFIKAKEMGYNGPEIPDFKLFRDSKHWHYVINPNALFPINPKIIGVCPFDPRVKTID